jgi:AraC-like DNA-binding protein
MSLMSVSGIISVSTDDLPERNRLETVREEIGKAIIKVELEPLPGQPFHFDAKLCALPDLGLAAGAISPFQGTLTRRLIEADDLVFNLTLSGGRILRQLGREAVLGPGEAGPTITTDPGVGIIHLPSRFISFRIPRKTLQPMIGDLDVCLIRTIPGNTEALRLLAGYAGLVEELGALADLQMRHVVATHFHDLISLALGATRDTAHAAMGRGVRAARLRAIKGDIVLNLARADLSIDGVARRHGITPRYLGMLFAGEGTLFTHFVLASRLDRAHRMLRDPRHAGRPVSAIAFACGFGDLSYFNRAFRRRFGATPSDVREAAR